MNKPDSGLELEIQSRYQDRRTISFAQVRIRGSIYSQETVLIEDEDIESKNNSNEEKYLQKNRRKMQKVHLSMA